MSQLITEFKELLKTVKLGYRKSGKSENYFVTISLAIIQKMKWIKSDELLIYPEGERLIIEKVQSLKENVPNVDYISKFKELIKALESSDMVKDPNTSQFLANDIKEWLENQDK